MNVTDYGNRQVEIPELENPQLYFEFPEND